MPHIFNARTIALQQKKAALPEFSWHTSPRLAELVKSKHLEFDIRSLDPGKFSYPYHS